MKERILLIALVFLPIMIFGQKEHSELSGDLEIGQMLKLESASVKFLEVASDSRCPKQVTCIWPGEAKVLLGITVMGEYIEREVVVSGTGAEITIAEDLQVSISHLRPYPKTARGIAPEEYCLRFAAVLSEKD